VIAAALVLTGATVVRLAPNEPDDAAPMILPFPDGVPGWVQLAVLVLGILFGLALLMMPFAVFGVKGRLDYMQGQLDDLQAELRMMAQRLHAADRPRPLSGGRTGEVAEAAPALRAAPVPRPAAPVRPVSAPARVADDEARQPRVRSEPSSAEWERLRRASDDWARDGTRLDDEDDLPRRPLRAAPNRDDRRREESRRDGMGRDGMGRDEIGRSEPTLRWPPRER